MGNNGAGAAKPNLRGKRKTRAITKRGKTARAGAKKSAAKGRKRR
ncbi:MAG TPA: hypothetical protein VKZ50_14950 [bacterium]|nr:hypothetical protein [bacterium]